MLPACWNFLDCLIITSYKMFVIVICIIRVKGLK